MELILGNFDCFPKFHPGSISVLINCTSWTTHMLFVHKFLCFLVQPQEPPIEFPIYWFLIYLLIIYSDFILSSFFMSYHWNLHPLYISLNFSNRITLTRQRAPLQSFLYILPHNVILTHSSFRLYYFPNIYIFSFL